MMFFVENLDLLMFVALCIFLMAGFPVAFTLGGTALLFAFMGYAFGVFDLTFVAFLKERIFGTMINQVLIAVPLFVFMGTMLERSKVAEELLETMAALFGKRPGGLGISVFLVGALLAASTGIVGATVVTMGLLSLPCMLRHGYSPSLASGVICAAGTLGQIIPPSIVLVLLGDQISNAYQEALRIKQDALWSQGVFDQTIIAEPISVGHLFAGALIPGLILVALYILYIFFLVWKKPHLVPALAKTEKVLSTRQVFQALFPPIILIVLVLGAILLGIAPPTEAASLGAVGAVFLAAIRCVQGSKRILSAGFYALCFLFALKAIWPQNISIHLAFQGSYLSLLAIILSLIFVISLLYALQQLYQQEMLRPVMETTMQTTSMVFMILIGAALFSLVFRGYGGDETIHEFLSGLPGGKISAFLITMLLMFVLGFFLDFIEITFVVVPIVAPILFMMDIHPLWLGVMMAMNLQTSFLTPPFGFALFYLRGVAPKTVKTWHIYKGVIPFIAIQLFMLIILALYPELVTALPDYLYN